MIKKLFEYILENGKESTRGNILNLFGKNDKVFTKKVEIPGEKLILNKYKIKYISLTSLNGKFDDVTIDDVRVNMKSKFGMWVNIYASSVPDVILKEIVNKLGIK